MNKNSIKTGFIFWTYVFVISQIVRMVRSVVLLASFKTSFGIIEALG